MLIFYNAGPNTPPISLNVGAVTDMLRRRVAFEQKSTGTDAVLLLVVVDAYGTVRRARALLPRVAGIFPRKMPRLYDEEGQPVEQVHWVEDPLVLTAAEEVARSLQFAPARRGGGYVNGRCRIVIQARG